MTPTRFVFLLLVASLAASAATAQTDAPPAPAATSNNPVTVRLNLAAIGIGAELRPFRNAPISLLAEVGTLHGAFDFTLGAYGLANNDYQYKPYPFLLKARGELRVYHNWGRRQRLGRNTNYFSGNYVTFGYLVLGQANSKETIADFIPLSPPSFGFYRFREVTGRYDGYLQLSYGIQRSFGRNNRWFYDFQLGYTYWVSVWVGGESFPLTNRDDRFFFNARAALGIRLF
jgi:hypothetical protein